MSKQNVGEVSAYFPEEGINKAYHRRIGNMFSEEGRDGVARLSIKLDFIPIGNRWQGWCNIYPPGTDKPPARKPTVTRQPSLDPNDDIPF